MYRRPVQIDSRMITTTICLFLILLFAVLFLKLCKTELQEVMNFFKGIVEAGLQELRFTGGRAAKANIILCAIVGALFGLIALHGVLNGLRELTGGEREHNSTLYLYAL